MRLDDHELDAIRRCAAVHFGPGATVRLFGSRARDHLRGGDIDLHVIAETAAQASSEAEYRFRSDLEDRIGEQKVDVLLIAPDEALRPIDRIAIRDGIVL